MAEHTATVQRLLAEATHECAYGLQCGETETLATVVDNLEVVVSLAEQDADWDAAWVAREVLDTAEDTHSLREMRNLLGDLRALERHLA